VNFPLNKRFAIIEIGTLLREDSVPFINEASQDAFYDFNTTFHLYMEGHKIFYENTEGKVDNLAKNWLERFQSQMESSLNQARGINSAKIPLDDSIHYGPSVFIELSKNQMEHYIEECKNRIKNIH
jgi:hypothetical protein